MRHFVARAALVGLLFVMPSAARGEPKVELLWPAGAPGAKGDSDNDKPTLAISLPPADKATGAAVVVCPGGGYGGLAMSYEGIDVGTWLNQHGVAAFVLKYRHKGSGYAHPAPLSDAQRAIPAQRAGARQHEIADPGEPRERGGARAERHAEASHFGQSTRDEGGARVVAQTDPLDDARRDRHHVLQRAAELHTDNVTLRVDTKLR